MNYDFDRVHDRRKSDSIKWNRFAEDVLPLWVADMDFLSPSPVIHALQNRVKEGIFGYSDVQESTKTSLCKWLQDRHGWTVSPDQVVLLPGVIEGFNIAARAYTNPGDSLILQTPAYHPFFHVAENNGLQQILASLEVLPDGRSILTRGSIIDRIRPDTRMLLFCNPHNPTGRVFDINELRVLAEICLERNLVICSDEIHSDIVYSPHRHIPVASLSDEVAGITITLISPSKTFNIAGLKAAAAVIPDRRLRDSFKNALQGWSGSVNVLGETALEAAYSRGHDWLDQLLAYLADNRKLLGDFVARDLPGVRISLPDGTYLGWLDFHETELDSPADFLLEHAKVALNPGEWFGPDYARFARINFGCPRETLLDALSRIKKSLRSAG